MNNVIRSNSLVFLSTSFAINLWNTICLEQCTNWWGLHVINSLFNVGLSLGQWKINLCYQLILCILAIYTKRLPNFHLLTYKSTCPALNQTARTRYDQYIVRKKKNSTCFTHLWKNTTLKKIHHWPRFLRDESLVK
jgi:hypothetical protein